MYVEVVPNRNSPPAILLREGWREARKRTLANLSSWPLAKIDSLRQLLKNEPPSAPTRSSASPASLPYGHV